jgi:general secretion pathway protein D
MKEIHMRTRKWRQNVFVSILLAFLMIPVPPSRLAWSQDDDNDEEQQTPAPATPAQKPQQPQAQPPAATPPPLPTTPAQRRLLPSPGQQKPAGGGDMVSLNFNRADLIEVIHVLAQHLGITYTIDPDVKGTVTINSAAPLRREDLFPIFHQILRINGAVAVKAGDNIYRIAPIEKGKGIARPATDDSAGGYAIQIIPLRFFSVAEMKRLLTPFLTPGAEVFDFPRGNFLMVVDLPSNVQRLQEIVDMIDVQTFVGTRTEMYQPKVASAEELAAEMTKIMQTYASSSAQAEGFAAQFISIPRINQLMIIADSEAAWTYVRRWLERLDTIGEGPGRKIHIYPVENGKAPDLADVLTQVLGISSGQQRQRGPTLEQLHRGTTGSTPQTTPGFGSRAPGFSGGGGFGGSPFSTPSTMGGGVQYLFNPYYPSMQAVAPAQAQQQPPVVTPPPAAAGPRGQQPRLGDTAARQVAPDEQLRIVADQNTNTLIIYGTAQEYQNIRTILKDLDIPARQVVLECLIAEVKLTDTNTLGFDYQLLKGPGKSGGFTDAFSVAGGPFPIQFGGTTGLAALLGGNVVRSIVTAIQTDNRSKILASPTILATDNQPARIQVGDEIPVATGTIDTSAGTGVATSTAIQSRNTGKILTVIPQVNARGQVNLQLKVEVSKQGGNVTVGSEGNSFPSFSTRDVETTAVVRDGDTLFIGGIFAEDRDRGRSGIPFLMDIPVFGWFFRKTTDTLTERTELIIMITPRVIRNNAEGLAATDDFRRKLGTVAGEIERMRRAPARDDLPPPKLVVPDKESKAEPQDAPSAVRLGNIQNVRPDSDAGPMPAEAEPPEKPGPMKTVVKYLTFGLVR